MTNIDTNKISLYVIVGLGLLLAWFSGNYVTDENYTPVLAIIGIFAVGVDLPPKGGHIETEVRIKFDEELQDGRERIIFTFHPC